MDEYQDPYQDTINELDRELNLCRSRRDSQRYDSADYLLFQREAETVMAELKAWRSARPALIDLDVRIADAESRVDREDRRLLNAVGAWHRGAWWCGGVGALLLLICWWWRPTPWLLM